MPLENRQKLYNLLNEQADIGTFDFFNQAMDAPDRRRKFFDQVSERFDLGTFDEFDSKMDVDQPITIPEGFFGGGKPSGKGAGGGIPTGAELAIKSGFEQSTLGLMLKQAMPDNYEAQNFWERQLQNAAGIVGDVPAMFVGALVGTAAGGGLASAITGTGAAFALPTAMRKVLMDKYEKGDVASFGELMSRTLDTVKEGAKGYITGAATGTVGKLPIGLAKLPAEIAALTTTSAALDKRIPKAQEFLDNAVLLLGMKVASKGAKQLRSIYARTGTEPGKVVDELARDLGYRGSAEDKVALQTIFQQEGNKAKVRTKIKELQESPVRQKVGELRKAETGVKSAEELRQRLTAERPVEAQTDIDAFGEVLQGTRRFVTGVGELVGGRRLGITPQEFSPESYRAALPHLKNAWEHYRRAGMKASEYIESVVLEYGEVARPYVTQFAKDQALTPIKAGSKPEHPASKTMEEAGISIKYEKSAWDTHELRQFVNSPEYIVRKHRRWFSKGEMIDLPEAREQAAFILEAQLRAGHSTHVVDEHFINEVEHLVRESRMPVLGKKRNVIAQEKIRGAMEELYNLSNENKAAETQQLIGSSSLHQAANRVIQWFEHTKGEVIEYKKTMYRLLMTDKMHSAFEEAIGKEKPDVGMIAEKYKVDKSELGETVKEYNAIEGWGVKDYITNIERGVYRIIDSDGHVRGLGVTRREAERKANGLSQRGKLKGKVTISPEFREPINPLKPRENILEGEKNIIDALRTYSYIVRKKMELEPIEAAMEKAFEKDEGLILYPKNVRNMLREQMIDAKGRYSWGDKLFDPIVKKLGTKPLVFSRGSARARTLVGFAKLGYRFVAGGVNFLAGHGHTWVGTSFKHMERGIQWMKTPEGKRLMAENEWALGMDFRSDIKGHLQPTAPLWTPFGIFSRPEPGIRRLGLAANYLWFKGTGLSSEAAMFEARTALRVQNFTYNTAALPRLLRGPGGRAVFMFKTYMVKELEFLSTLNGQQWAKYLTMQLAMSGPRGILLFVRSLPIIGMLGAWDKIDEWLLHKRKQGALGIPGFLGADISAPATMQIVADKPEDMGGPVISEFIKGMEATVWPVIRGEDPRLIKEGTKDWLSNFAIIYRYIDTILQAETSPDGWIRDRFEVKRNEEGRLTGVQIGEKKYRFGSEWEKRYLQVLSAAGIQAADKTRVSNAQNLLMRDEIKDRANRKKLVTSIIRDIDRSENVPDWKWDEMTMLGMSPQSVFARKKINEMSPQERAAIREQLIDRAKAWQIFID